MILHNVVMLGMDMSCYIRTTHKDSLKTFVKPLWWWLSNRWATGAGFTLLLEAMSIAKTTATKQTKMCETVPFKILEWGNERQWFWNMGKTEVSVIIASFYHLERFSAYSSRKRNWGRTCQTSCVEEMELSPGKPRKPKLIGQTIKEKR